MLSCRPKCIQRHYCFMAGNISLRKFLSSIDVINDVFQYLKNEKIKIKVEWQKKIQENNYSIN